MWNIHWNLRGTQEREDWGFITVDNIDFDFTFWNSYWYSLFYPYFIWAPIYYLFNLSYSLPNVKLNGGNSMIFLELNSGIWIQTINQQFGENVAIVSFVIKQLLFWSSFALIGLHFNIKLNLKWFITILLRYLRFSVKPTE